MIRREDLKAKGYTDEQIDHILDEFHKEQEGLKGQIQTLTTERDAARGEVAKYKQGGELYQDPTELEALRKFKTDTEAEKANAKKTQALTKLYQGANATESAVKLLIKSTDLSGIELDEKGEVKGGADILKKAKEDYSDFFGTVDGAGAGGGAPHATGTNGGAQTGFNFNFTGVRAKPEAKK